MEKIFKLMDKTDYNHSYRVFVSVCHRKGEYFCTSSFYITPMNSDYWLYFESIVCKNTANVYSSELRAIKESIKHLNTKSNVIFYTCNSTIANVLSGKWKAKNETKLIDSIFRSLSACKIEAQFHRCKRNDGNHRSSKYIAKHSSEDHRLGIL